MFSFITKRLGLATGIISRFRSNAFEIKSLTTDTRLMSSHTKNPYEMPCKMEYPKKNSKEYECRPLEPRCSVPLRSEQKLEDSCKTNFDCCDSERLARDPCNCKGARIWKQNDMKLQKKNTNHDSVWEYPAECCDDICKDFLPRFDTLYYKPSDKAKRQYQQTWVECPKIQTRKRRVCCYDSTLLPPICRRKKAECPTTACAFDSQKLVALCKGVSNKRCPTIQSLFCLRGIHPPKCRKIRPIRNCQKKCCPYPAFSECCCPCPTPTRKTECECNKVVPMCFIYRGLKRKLAFDLPPPLPAWPPKLIPPRF